MRDELLRLPDAAKVEIYGAQEERLFLEFTNTRLTEYGLSASMLADILSAQNIVSAGGSVVVDTERLSLEPTGNFETVAELEGMTVAVPSGQLVPLRDLVDVRRGTIDPPRTLRRANGMPALGLAVSMRDGGNLITLGDEVRALVAELGPRYPLGIELDFAQFQPDVVSQKVSEFESNLGQSVLIVAAVMLVTLGLRTGLVVASLVPTAIVSAIMVMGFLEIGLDQMSLAALIIALGMLVDNAIVMSESIMVQMSGGKEARSTRPSTAAKEFAGPAARLRRSTTAAAFLPIYLAENASGEYTAPIFKVVTITLLCSWLVSLTLIPLLCVRFLRVETDPEADSFDSRGYRSYRGILSQALARPWLSLAGMVAVLCLALWAFRFLPNLFFPANERPLLVAEFALPFGTAIEHTAETSARIDARIAETLLVDGDAGGEGVESWVTYVGEGGPRFTLGYSSEESAPYVSAMLINATSREASLEIAPALERWANESSPA